MKWFLVKKNILLVIGFVLLAILPFAITKKQILPGTKDDTLNPYPVPKDPAAAYIQKASDNYFYREFPEAAENYRKAIAIYEEREDFAHVAKTYESLGDLFVWANQTDKAEVNYLEAIKYHTRNQDVLGQANALKSLADMYMKLDYFEPAEKWYRQSLHVLKNEPPNRVLASVQEGLGHLYWKTELYPEAISAFTEARETFDALHYQMGVDHMTNVLKRLQRVSESGKPPAPAGKTPDNITPHQ